MYMDFLNSFIQWFVDRPEILVGLGISSFFIFLLSILGISWFIANIPEDYFLASKRKNTKWRDQKPLLRLVVIFVKNIIGVLLIVGGLLMLVLPCLLYTSPSPRDATLSRMPSSA